MPNDYDVWKKFGNTYKCGCCGRIPTYVDIRDLKECFFCEHLMNYYEGENGELILLRADGSVWRRVVDQYQFAGEESLVAVHDIQVS